MCSSFCLTTQFCFFVDPKKKYFRWYSSCDNKNLPDLKTARKILQLVEGWNYYKFPEPVYTSQQKQLVFIFGELIVFKEIIANYYKHRMKYTMALSVQIQIFKCYLHCCSIANILPQRAKVEQESFGTRPCCNLSEVPRTQNETC